MNDTQAKTIANLYPMLEEGALSPERLFYSGPVKGSSVRIDKDALMTAWKAVSETGNGRHIHQELSDGRVQRKLQEAQMCQVLARNVEVILLEYSYQYRQETRSKIMLSQGACELLALHLSDAPLVADGSGLMRRMSSDQLAIIERSGGMVGEFKQQTMPTLIDMGEILRQKIAAAATF